MRRIIFVILFLPLVASAQSDIAVLYDFTNGVSTSGDGPDGTLICSSNVFYGTTYGGGSNNLGVIFTMNSDGTGYTNLHSFAAFSNGTNADGAEPAAPLLLLGNSLFGTAEAGGLYGFGTVFSINTDGTDFTNLHSFSSAPEDPALSYARTNYDGANPVAGLAFTNGMLYGTAYEGGTNGDGTIFELSTNGENFATLRTFSGAPDGETPDCGLTLFNGLMYGATAKGGTHGDGCIFRLNMDGSGYTNIYNFTAGNYDPNSGYYTNFDGDGPRGVLLLLNGSLFGTAGIGGSNDFGTVFKLSTNGSNFTVLHTFTGLDGKEPYAGLVNLGSTLYGATSVGGAGATNGNDGGTVFQINSAGFSTLQNFSDRQDGSTLYGGVVLSSNTLYGAAYSGGAEENGDIYAIPLSSPSPSPVPLVIALAGTNIVLTWTNPAFALEAAPTVTSAFTNVPGASSPYTNFPGGAQAFFQLVAP